LIIASIILILPSSSATSIFAKAPLKSEVSNSLIVLILFEVPCAVIPATKDPVTSIEPKLSVPIPD